MSKNEENKRTNAQDVISLRNRFFYIYYRKISLIFLITLGISAFALVSAFYFATRPTPPIYIPVSVDGRLIPSYKLSEPSIKDKNIMEAAVKQWVLECARKLYRYDYINYAEQIFESQPYFSIRGWNYYIKEFENSQTLNTVLAQKMIVNFIPQEPPEIVQEKVGEDGRLRWAVQFPAKIKFISHDNTGKMGFIQNVMVKAIVIRVSSVDSPKGIAVDTIVFEENVKRR